MDIVNLQAFISVAETGSFSLTAQRLFLTQPAISKRIALLERELDATLFDRVGRNISLTEAGKVLLPRARKIIAEIEDSRREIQNLSTEVSGTLKFATSHHIGLHHLPPVLRQYSKIYPDVELDIHFMDSETACSAVLQGQLELAIVTLPTIPNPLLGTQSIWDDPLTVVVGKTHPLAAHTRVQAKQLAQHNAILPAKGTFTRDIIEKELLPYTHALHVKLASNYLETIKMMVSVGLGWSILPASMQDKDVLPLNIRNIKMQRQLGLVHHAERILSNAANAMCMLLKS